MKLGFPGDAIHGLIERPQQGLIGSPHRQEERDAKDDSCRSEQRTQKVLAEVGPRNETEEDHQGALTAPVTSSACRDWGFRPASPSAKRCMTIRFYKLRMLTQREFVTA